MTRAASREPLLQLLVPQCCRRVSVAAAAVPLTISASTFSQVAACFASFSALFAGVTEGAAVVLLLVGVSGSADAEAVPEEGATSVASGEGAPPPPVVVDEGLSSMPLSLGEDDMAGRLLQSGCSRYDLCCG